MNGHTKGIRIVVEGPECVGKDTFINNLVAAINRQKAGVELEPVNAVRRKLRNSPNFFKGLNHRQIKKILKHDTMAEVPVTMGKLHSVKVINFIDNCKETREFYQRLHAGSLTQLEIAQEFLQVHYDNELYTRECETVSDIVIMNRGIHTYKANQIIGDGLTQFEEQWLKLRNHSYEDEAILVLLKAPKEVVAERLRKREENDFRGSIEQHFLERHDAISAYYQELLQSGYYSETYELDTSSSEQEQKDFIKELVSDIQVALTTHQANTAHLQPLEEVSEQYSETINLDDMFQE